MSDLDDTKLEDLMGEIMDASRWSQDIVSHMSRCESGSKEVEAAQKLANELEDHLSSAETCETMVDFVANVKLARKAAADLKDALKAAIKVSRRDADLQDEVTELEDAQGTLRDVAKELNDVTIEGDE